MIPRNRLTRDDLVIMSNIQNKAQVKPWSVYNIYGGESPCYDKPNISGKEVTHGYQGAYDEELVIYGKAYLQTV